VLVGVHDSLHPVPQPELIQHPADVCLDCGLGQEELAGDLGVRQARGNLDEVDRTDLITGSTLSRRDWRVQRYRIRPHWCQRSARFAHPVAVAWSVADPDGHHVPAVEPGAWNGGLVNDDSVEQWLGGVGVRPGEEESTIMAEQPGVQGLHAAEVRNLDEFRMCGR